MCSVSKYLTGTIMNPEVSHPLVTSQNLIHRLCQFREWTWVRAVPGGPWASWGPQRVKITAPGPLPLPGHHCLYSCSYNGSQSLGYPLPLPVYASCICHMRWGRGWTRGTKCSIIAEERGGCPGRCHVNAFSILLCMWPSGGGGSSWCSPWTAQVTYC